MVFVQQSEMTHFIIPMILKNKNKVAKAVKRSLLKAVRLTKIQEGHISDVQKLLMIWIEDEHSSVSLSAL